jgi:OOP family OmpA-OmpF porin
MQRIFSIAGALCAAFLAGTLSASAEQQLAIENDGDAISLQGHISSAAHETILARSVSEHFPAHTASMDLVIRPAMPPGWALITDITLQALAETLTATALITPDRIELQGYTVDPERWSKARQRITDNLLPGMQFDVGIVRMGPAAPLSRQCIELFRTALRGRSIAFAVGSADVGTATMPLLDELVQIAADCPAAVIRITGHTDSSGDEATNLALSRARAEAVAAYMANAGIAGSRITAIGVGSAEPLVNETGARARRLNRRIDVELSFP